MNFQAFFCHCLILINRKIFMDEKFPTTRSRKVLSDIKKDFGSINILLLVIGLFLLAVGGVILTLANETASNFAGYLSPFLLFAGIILIVISFLVEPQK
jgi:hypothetical protein